MTMTKYAVDVQMVRKLIELGLCDSEEAALEKTASGEAAALIEKAEREATTKKEPRDA